MKKFSQYKTTTKAVFAFIAAIVLLIITIGAILFSKNYICEVKRGFNYKGQHTPVLIIEWMARVLPLLRLAVITVILLMI